MTTRPSYTARRADAAEPLGRLSDPRAWFSLAVFVVAWRMTPIIMPVLEQPLGMLLRPAAMPPHTLIKNTLAVYTIAYLIWSFAVLSAVALALGRSPLSFPIDGPARWQRGGLGLATGLAAMLLVMIAIMVTGAARVTPSGQTPIGLLVNGVLWFLLDASVGAGEEFFFRGALYLAVASLLGWRAAVVVSGVLFLVLHLDNPGASPIWLARIALSGMLLAFAVHRTGSIWWSIGYHAGWNWISAPLFGAAVSGYDVEGHLLNFTTHGPMLITGGAVGPEGSIFAYLAMLLALTTLMLVTRSRTGSTRKTAT